MTRLGIGLGVVCAVGLAFLWPLASEEPAGFRSATGKVLPESVRVHCFVVW